MFFVMPIQIKRKIYDKLVNFQFGIENLSNRKIKYIRLGGDLRSNAFDV